MLNVFTVSLKVVLPMGVLMCLGMAMRKWKIADRETMRKMDTAIFKVFMPTLLFKSIYDADFSKNSDGKMLLFALIGMLVIFIFAWFVPNRVYKDQKQAASIAMALVRSNYVLFGITVAESLYGEGNIGSVAVLGALIIPLTNAMSVILLERNRNSSISPWQLFLSVCKNPLVIASLLALLCCYADIKLPAMVYSMVKDVAGITTTLSFVSLGVSLEFGALRSNRHILIQSLSLRMFLLPLIFMFISVFLGFKGTQLCALMVLFAGPVAVATYPMAVAMGADGPLSGQIVCTSTVLSIITLFCFTLVLTYLGLL